MNTTTLLKKMDKKNRIDAAVWKVVYGRITGTSKEYAEALDNYYEVLNKELGIK